MSENKITVQFDVDDLQAFRNVLARELGTQILGKPDSPAARGWNALNEAFRAAVPVKVERAATIARAVAWLEQAPHKEALTLLADLRLHQHLREDPAALAASLRDGSVETGGRAFGAWNAAMQVCQAAGLLY